MNVTYLLSTIPFPGRLQQPTERVVRGEQDNVGDDAGLGGGRADHVLRHRTLHAQQGEES